MTEVTYRKVRLDSGNLAVFEVPTHQGHRDVVWVRCYGRHVATKFGGEWFMRGTVKADDAQARTLEAAAWANGSNSADTDIAASA